MRVVTVELLGLSVLQMKKNSFEGKISLKLRWREPDLDGKDDNANIKIKDYWNPKVYIGNAIEIMMIESQIDRDAYYKHETYMIETKLFYGNFKLILNIFNFPFDIQTVHMDILSYHPPTEVLFQAESVDGKLSFLYQSLCPEEFIMSNEYRMEDLQTLKKNQTFGYGLNGLRGKIFLKRKTKFYIGSMIHMFIYSLIFICTMGIEADLFLYDRFKSCIFLCLLICFSDLLENEESFFVSQMTAYHIYFVWLFLLGLLFVNYNILLAAVKKNFIFVDTKKSLLIIDIAFSSIAFVCLIIFNFIYTLWFVVGSATSWRQKQHRGGRRFGRKMKIK